MMKACFKCKAIKPISEFYTHRMMADGHLNKCKQCTKQDVREWYGRTPVERRAYEQRRSRLPERRAQLSSNVALVRARAPEKYRARTAVGNALRDGRLIKTLCSSCGSAERVEGHHDDYSRPLDVEWLCFRCHRNKQHGQRVLPF